jgi:hypothetical protein
MIHNTVLMIIQLILLFIWQKRILLSFFYIFIYFFKFVCFQICFR